MAPNTLLESSLRCRHPPPRLKPVSRSRLLSALSTDVELNKAINTRQPIRLDEITDLDPRPPISGLVASSANVPKQSCSASISNVKLSNVQAASIRRSAPNLQKVKHAKTSIISNDMAVAQPKTVGADPDVEMAEEPPSFSYKTVFCGQRPPVRVYTSSYDETEELCGLLRGPLGFDMEWQVSWLRIPRRTALVQVSDERMILIIQLSDMTRFPPQLKKLIESPTVIKTGVNIRNDGMKLFKDFGIVGRNLVELSFLARQADPAYDKKRHVRTLISLAKIVRTYTGTDLGKESNIRMGKWESSPLTDTQLEYAANDAHCALVVYSKLLALAAKSKSHLDPTTYATDLDREDLATLLLGAEPAPDASGSSESSPVQSMRAYKMWHEQKLPLIDICVRLRSKDNPLKESTVISYVVQALRGREKLPFEKQALWELAQLEAGSYVRHRAFLWGLFARSTDVDTEIDVEAATEVVI